jgi:hypothetical protein
MHPVASDRVHERRWIQGTIGFRRQIHIGERNPVKPRVEFCKKLSERMNQDSGAERLSVPNTAGKLTDAPKLLAVEKSNATAGFGEVGWRAAIKAIKCNYPLREVWVQSGAAENPRGKPGRNTRYACEKTLKVDVASWDSAKRIQINRLPMPRMCAGFARLVPDLRVT